MDYRYYDLDIHNLLVYNIYIYIYIYIYNIYIHYIILIKVYLLAENL